VIDTVIVWCCAAAGAEAESFDEWQLGAVAPNTSGILLGIEHHP